MKHMRWIALIMIGLLLAACAHQFSGVAPNPIGPAPDFALTDENGQPFKLSDLRGKWILLAYGYTHCPDVCPLTLSHLRDVKQAIDPTGDKVQVAFVTIDPDRDTPDVMRQYVGHFDQQFEYKFKGLSGTPAQIAAAAQPYNVKYEKKADNSANGYSMAHTAEVYLIDPQFNWRMTFPFGIEAQEIASDVQYLMQNSEAK
ncbi:MAG TPA: SCO family protein [Anaerolineae bacterium]|nr:SCO family protein [Anaerolineae bacterium]